MINTKLVLTIACILGMASAETFGLMEKCKKTIPEVWGNLLTVTSQDETAGTDSNSTLAVRAWVDAFHATCRFSGNDTNEVNPAKTWPQKATWNLTCDDDKEISLAKAEINVFRTFGKSSLKDPLLDAFYKIDDTLFNLCEHRWGQDTRSFFNNVFDLQNKKNSEAAIN